MPLVAHSEFGLSVELEPVDNALDYYYDFRRVGFVVSWLLGAPQVDLVA